MKRKFSEPIGFASIFWISAQQPVHSAFDWHENQSGILLVVE
jgi:hypothetical protein